MDQGLLTLHMLNHMVLEPLSNIIYFRHPPKSILFNRFILAGYSFFDLKTGLKLFISSFSKIILFLFTGYLFSLYST